MVVEMEDVKTLVFLVKARKEIQIETDGNRLNEGDNFGICG
jgi:hypothetical protein